MIARLSGTLLELDAKAGLVLLEVGDIAYEVMVPAYALSSLSSEIGRAITLYCLEYYEGSGTGTSMVPLLVGFPQAGDKAFFRRFISVKGIGIRKALRALSIPLADVAFAIEEGDAKRLQSLPEIGKRTAEQIVAELKGKMGEYAVSATGRAAKPARPLSDIEKEALEILLQLGEKRAEAEELIDRVMKSDEQADTTDALVQAVYRLKSGVKI